MSLLKESSRRVMAESVSFRRAFTPAAEQAPIVSARNNGSPKIRPAVKFKFVENPHEFGHAVSVGACLFCWDDSGDTGPLSQATSRPAS
jgi:hypothetical protein